MPANERYVVPLGYDPVTRTLGLELEAGPVPLDMIPQPQRTRSCITPQTRQDLLHGDALSSSDRDFREDLTIVSASLAGVPLFSVPVEISDHPNKLGADGILGFDFFTHFTEMSFVFPPHRLILVDP